MITRRMWNQRFAALPAFPFRRLAAALEGTVPPAHLPPLDLALGEPQHAPPPLLAETVAANAESWNRYPPPAGTSVFRQAAVDWLARRFSLPSGWLDPDRHVVPCAGTKEALFLIASVALNRGRAAARPCVLMPDPLYAVYLGAAVLADADPVPLPTSAATGFLPDLDAIPAADLERAIAFYLCTPANPQGAIADQTYLARALDLARRYGFLLIVDECYAEIYDDSPPPSALAATLDLGGGLDNLVVLHSLSKRSNAAGLRSGFVAGDPEFLALFLRLRGYGGAVQPLPVMAAAAALWADDIHAAQNRVLYRRKIDLAEQFLAGRFGFYRPAGGFFLWLDVGDGVAAALRLWREAHLKVLPGCYLTVGDGVAEEYIRVALVHDEVTLATALERLVAVLGGAAPASIHPVARER